MKLGNKPSKGAVCNSCDTKFSACLQKTDVGVLNINGKWRVFDLNGINVVHLTSSAQSVGGDLGESEILDLSLSVDAIVSKSTQSR